MQTARTLGIVSLIAVFAMRLSYSYHCVRGFRSGSRFTGTHFRRDGLTWTSSILSTTGSTSFASSLPKQLPIHLLSSNVVAFSTSATGTAATTTFQPPKPPGTKGTPIFPDIQILKPDESNPTENAIRRNTDSNAVMVVTGANRGIGLQFVRSLLSHTKVFTQHVNVQVLQLPFRHCSYYLNLSYRVQSLLVVVRRKQQLNCKRSLLH